MIVPIYGLKYYSFSSPSIDELLVLHKEKNNPHDEFAIAAYNTKNEKVGYLSRKAIEKYRIYDYITTDVYFSRIWAIYPNQLLVELDLSNNPLPKKKYNLKST